MPLFLFPKSRDYILYASSSFKYHIILMGWERKGRVQQPNYNMGWWQGTPPLSLVSLSLPSSSGGVCSPARGGGQRDKSRPCNAASPTASSQGGYYNFHKMAPASDLCSQKCLGWVAAAAVAVACQESPGHPSLSALAGRQAIAHSHPYPNTCMCTC